MPIIPKVLLFVCVFGLSSSCRKSALGEQESPEETSASEQDSIAIAKVIPIAPKAGDTISVQGKNFQESVSMTFDGALLSDVRLLSSDLIQGVMPKISRIGRGKLIVAQDASEAEADLLYAGSEGDYPIVTKPASEICQGEKFYNAEGELKEGTRNCSPVTGPEVPSPCSQTTQASCLAENICQWTNGSCSIDPWNIRYGKTIAGITGALKTNCRNRINSSRFNSDIMPPGNTGTTVGVNFDPWDTLDDYNNNSTVPTSKVTSWGDDTVCEQSIWKDNTADGSCDSALDDCLMLDRISGLTWSESYPVSGSASTSTTLNWSSALQFCDNLTFGGFSDWRLPTQKEGSDAYNHGLRGLGYNGTGTIRATGSLDNNNDFIANVDGNFWTSTTDSGNTSWAWNYYPTNGAHSGNAKTTLYPFLCVRP